MPQNRPRTAASASRTPAGSHTGRRRHAAPSSPNWTRRAGIVGGVVSAIALSGAAAPAIADNHSGGSPETGQVSARTLSTSLSTPVTGEQAADAIAQDAIEMSIAADRQEAADRAAAQAKAAAAAAAAKHKAAVAAKAAKARATASALAASRSAKRAALSASASATPASTSSTAAAVAPSGTKVEKLIAFLKAQIGKPYVYGATGPDSYDCSGLTQVAYATVGVELPRTSQEQSTVGTPVSLNSLKAGDLIFWGGEGSAFHVGVYIGNGQYLDAANPSSPVGIKQMVDYEPDWAVRVL
jgi:cell wall-associated NlpC family hydrolase